MTRWLMTMAGLGLCAGALAGTLAAAGSQADTPPAAASAGRAGAASPYGVCAHVTRGQPLEQSLDWVKMGGIQWVRIDFDWEGMQTRDGTWDFTRYDRVFAEAEKRGLTILPIIDAHSIHRPGGRRPHEQLDAWAAFVTQAIERYGRHLPVVEVWNEPDAPRCPLRDPALYTALLKRTYETVKRVDPSIRVALAGLTGSPYAYLDGLYAHGAKDISTS